MWNLVNDLLKCYSWELKTPYDKGQSLQTARNHIRSCVIGWTLWCLGKRWDAEGAGEVDFGSHKYLGEPSSEGPAPGFHLSSVS